MTADRTTPAAVVIAVVIAGVLAVAGCGATVPASAPPSTAPRPDPVDLVAQARAEGAALPPGWVAMQAR
jgi:hypothetical protein